MDAKIAIPLYAEHLHFLVPKCGWRVTKIRGHYTFEQSKSKKEFVIMNQVSRKNSQTDVEKDLYKLMNNANLVTIVAIMVTIVIFILFMMK